MKELEIGTVIFFIQGTKKGYWKILSTRIDGFFRLAETYYNVIKCSKTGKEYRMTTGFRAEWIHECIEDLRIKVITVSPIGIKADIEEGVRKRRIQHLEARIMNDTVELSKLRGKR